MRCYSLDCAEMQAIGCQTAEITPLCLKVQGLLGFQKRIGNGYHAMAVHCIAVHLQRIGSRVQKIPYVQTLKRKLSRAKVRLANCGDNVWGA
jgi:hypothetical protein